MYDPAVVSFGDLLEVFTSKLPTSEGHATVGSHLTFDQMVAQHNPKDDHGTQYRSAVFTHTDQQQEEAEAWKKNLEAERGPIVTSIEPAGTFYPAEECESPRGRAVCVANCPPRPRDQGEPEPTRSNDPKSPTSSQHPTCRPPALSREGRAGRAQGEHRANQVLWLRTVVDEGALRLDPGGNEQEGTRRDIL